MRTQLTRSSVIVNGQWTEPVEKPSAYSIKDIQTMQEMEKELPPNQRREAELEEALKAALAKRVAKDAPKPQRMATMPPEASLETLRGIGGGIRVSENEGRNGVEIRFPQPVNRNTSLALMRAGFRFTRSLNDPRWYAKRKPHTMAFAKQIAGDAGMTAVISTTTETKPVATPILTTEEEFQWM